MGSDYIKMLLLHSRENVIMSGIWVVVVSSLCYHVVGVSVGTNGSK